MVTDFQKNGWIGDEGVHLPPGTIVTPVPWAGTSTRTCRWPTYRWSVRRWAAASA